MGTVKQLLEEKGHDYWSIEPDASVYEALRVMAEKNVGALLVVQSGELVGIFSERDYARHSIQDERTNFIIPVSDLMTSSVLYVNPDKRIEDCMALMTAKHVRHLPVMEGNRLVGIISIGDVVKRIISEQQFTISELEKYTSR